MSFGEAFGFPFKAENLPKILNFILIYTIIIAVILVGGLLFNSFTTALFLTAPVSIAYSLFVSGYTIEVIRRIMEGEDVLPASDLGRDIKRGFVVGVAGFVYMLPIIILFICVFSMIPMSSYGYSSMGSMNNSGDSLLPICGAFIVALGLLFFSGNALMIGMIRYAAEDRSGALYEFGHNFGYVTSNFGKLMGLFVRSFGIGIIFALVSGMIAGLIPTTETITPRGYLNVGAGLVAFFVIESVISQTLTFMSQMSIAHLQARFGLDVGIFAGKSKHDDYNF